MRAVAEIIPTSDGSFTVIVDTDAHVVASGWTEDIAAFVSRIHPSLRPNEVTLGVSGLAQIVESYYAGDLSAVTAVPLRQMGTSLQLSGWESLRRIPAGLPVSYANFAQLMGRPSAVRAAASVCARNAVALFVPCHRVIRGDGSLGGFAWGLDVKESLLDREARFSR